MSPGFMDHALRLMDALIKVMRQRMHDFIREGDYYKVVVSGEQLEWL